MDPQIALRMVKSPYVTEKTFQMAEKENKLVFIVDRSLRKSEIAKAISILYDVKVQTVNTANTVYGKKAYVRLAKESSATDLATRLGLV